MSDLTAGPSPNEDGPEPKRRRATGTTLRNLRAQLEELEDCGGCSGVPNHSEEELGRGFPRTGRSKLRQLQMMTAMRWRGASDRST